MPIFRGEARPREFGPNGPDQSAQPLYDPDRPPVDTSSLPAEQPAQLDAEQSAQKYASLPADEMVAIEVADMVTARKQASEDFRTEKKRVWDKCWEHYRQVYDKSGKEPWQSTTFQPDTTKVVEIITANLYSALSAPVSPAEWQCRVKEYEDQVRWINKIVAKDLEHAKFKPGLIDYLRSLCIVGTSVGKVGYKLREEVIMAKNKPSISIAERAMSQFLGRAPQIPPESFSPQKMKVEDWAAVEYVDLYKIFPQPHTDKIHKDHWIIEESTITNAELVKLANDPDPFYQLQNVTPDLLNQSFGKPMQYDDETNARRYALMQGDPMMHYLDPDTPHQLLEYWGPVPIWMLDPSKRHDEATKNESINAWIWIVDGKWCVRKRPTPNRDAEPPYFKDSYMSVPGDWYGIGPAEIMIGLQIEKNEIVNTGSDQVNLSLQKIIAVLKDKVPPDTWKRLKSEPGGIWPFEGEDIKKVFAIIDFPDMTKDWYMKIEMVDRAIQESTAAVKATIGVGGAEEEAGGGTFRGQLMNKQVAGERFMLTAKGIEANGLKDIYRKVYQQVYQFKSYDSVAQILGPDDARKFEFILPEQLDNVANLVPLGVMTLETKGAKMGQMDGFSRLWMNEVWFKKYDMARKMWLEMGNSDPDSVVFSEEELQQFNDFRRQMMQAFPGLPGSAPGQGAGPGPGRGVPPGQPQAGNTPPAQGGGLPTGPGVPSNGQAPGLPRLK